MLTLPTEAHNDSLCHAVSYNSVALCVNVTMVTL